MKRTRNLVFEYRCDYGARSFALHWDADYGMDHRRGWSVSVGGSWLVQHEPRLLVALWRAWRTARKWSEG